MLGEKWSLVAAGTLLLSEKIFINFDFAESYLSSVIVAFTSYSSQVSIFAAFRSMS